MREPVRLAALSHAKAVFVFSHDSVGVGEDGPTHQPVEHLATLRAVPQLQVIRPADGNETAAAWRAAIDHDGPTAIVLTRQGVTVCTDGSAVERGAGIVVDGAAGGNPAVIIVATGSEVSLAVEAATQLNADGVATRVVSLPSWDRFAAQGAEYRQQLLPAGVPVLSVEAATTFGWERYADDMIGIDRFGVSAPGAEVLERLGINLDHVLAAGTRPRRSLTHPGGPMDSKTHPALRGTGPEPLARQPDTGVTSPRASWRGCATAGSAASRRTRRSSRRRSPVPPTTTTSSRRSPPTTDRSSTTTGRSSLATSRRACDVFDPLYESSDGGDGFVSVEVGARAGQRLGRHRAAPPASCTSRSPSAT